MKAGDDRLLGARLDLPAIAVREMVALEMPSAFGGRYAWVGRPWGDARAAALHAHIQAHGATGTAGAYASGGRFGPHSESWLEAARTVVAAFEAPAGALPRWFVVRCCAMGFLPPTFIERFREYGFYDGADRDDAMADALAVLEDNNSDNPAMPETLERLRDPANGAVVFRASPSARKYRNYFILAIHIPEGAPGVNNDFCPDRDVPEEVCIMLSATA